MGIRDETDYIQRCFTSKTLFGLFIFYEASFDLKLFVNDITRLMKVLSNSKIKVLARELELES